MSVKNRYFSERISSDSILPVSFTRPDVFFQQHVLQVEDPVDHHAIPFRGPVLDLDPAAAFPPDFDGCKTVGGPLFDEQAADFFHGRYGGLRHR
jgi:hypothetical protein